MSLRLPEDEYKALCKAILQRDGWRCRSCGFRADLHCHHVVYRSHQGEDSAENLLALCSQCHEAVHRSDLCLVYVDPSRGAEGIVQFFRRNGWRPQ